MVFHSMRSTMSLSVKGSRPTSQASFIKSPLSSSWYSTGTSDTTYESVGGRSAQDSGAGSSKAQMIGRKLGQLAEGSRKYGAHRAVQWFSKRRIVWLIRAIFLLAELIITATWDLYRDVAIMSIIIVSSMLLWDIFQFLHIYWPDAFEVNYEMCTYIESAAVVAILGEICYLMYNLIQARLPPPLAMLLLWLPILGVTVFFAYEQVRSYKENRRIYVRSKPLIVFTAAGDPTAVIADNQFALGSAVESAAVARRSVDSLLQSQSPEPETPIYDTSLSVWSAV
ncbi:hypothetical protein BX600DRAFT_51140 [Xylariales sp. PMI_506]|nr:hypothetical protein BX600DRAFT_51140 [Xylariales sp. PMI_506]